MAKGPRYRVPFRRDREKKTDYRRRVRLLMAGKPRAVVRSSGAHTFAQVVEFSPTGDKALATASSKQLENLGWKGSGKNLSACYLVGRLLAQKAREAGVKEAVLDLGLTSPIAGSKKFAVLRGIVEGELEVPHSKDVFPPEERIRGEHVAEYAKSMKKREKEKHFSNYLAKGLDPEKLPQHFDEVLNKIRSA